MPTLEIWKIKFKKLRKLWSCPTNVFIDAVGSKRHDSSSGGIREIQRAMLELLNQLDGFDERVDVKVTVVTNKIESLDPALIRPGRVDRKIEFPLPDTKNKRHMFNIHTMKMTLADDVDLEKLVMAKDELSGADIKAARTEASMLALRERRMKVCQEDFVKAKEKPLHSKKRKCSQVIVSLTPHVCGGGGERETDGGDWIGKMQRKEQHN